MNITVFAQKFKLPTDTVRFYEKAGLLKPERQPNGYRNFTDTDQQDLKMILALKELDFSIKEISYLLELKRQPISSHCNNNSTEFIANKIDFIKQKMTFYEMAYQLLLKLKATIENNNYAKNQAELFDLIDQLSTYGLKEEK
ncbi:MerR family transcriptional regulator [Enterococcus quebecensis]|uniref:HTH merR-type domain-containing protein n=1 Tax=Enterococcus quebecensis TaxID=903983 RepID=A0A1E5GR70_9ENTE|nr:MerR family transcriptional regulator [Enterococcus quebecensis]OEG15221.1 hypothetical protein BCR23_10320 [Enterococcus quebecensis]OJG74802.1 hypothetical protein RV12_GL002219 [Enterococcus quebecensis]